MTTDRNVPMKWIMIFTMQGRSITAIHNVGGEHSQFVLHSSEDREIVAVI